MLIPNSSFRPDPERSICLVGPITQALLNDVTPQILNLQHTSRDPITIYIDSPGGETAVAEKILALLLASNQDLDPPCQLITVVTGLAASVAADLLCTGDYALAHPSCTIHFHGVRYLDAELTRERASQLADSLKRHNDDYAWATIQRCIERFIFRYLTNRDEFKSVQARGTDESDLKALFAYLKEQVSSKARKVLDAAMVQYNRYGQLQAHVAKSFKSSQLGRGARIAEVEAFALREIINFELVAHPEKAWSFRKDALSDLQNDFYLLMEFLAPRHQKKIAAVSQRFQEILLSEKELAEVAALPPEQQDEARTKRLTKAIEPMWFFFFALCTSLQQGENPMTALDAYWLGLIDEVIGVDLPSPRILIEYSATDTA